MPTANERSPKTPTRARPSELPDLVRMDEVAAALSVTERHLRRLVAERRIPFVKVGYFIRFDPRDVARWLAEHRVEVYKKGARR